MRLIGSIAIAAGVVCFLVFSIIGLEAGPGGPRVMNVAGTLAGITSIICGTIVVCVAEVIEALNRNREAFLRRYKIEQAEMPKIYSRKRATYAKEGPVKVETGEVTIYEFDGVEFETLEGAQSAAAEFKKKYVRS